MDQLPQANTFFQRSKQWVNFFDQNVQKAFLTCNPDTIKEEAYLLCFPRSENAINKTAKTKEA